MAGQPVTMTSPAPDAASPQESALNAVTGTLSGLTDMKGLPEVVAVPLDVDPGVEIAAPVYPGTPIEEPSSIRSSASRGARRPPPSPSTADRGASGRDR